MSTLEIGFKLLCHNGSLSTVPLKKSIRELTLPPIEETNRYIKSLFTMQKPRLRNFFGTQHQDRKPEL